MRRHPRQPIEAPGEDSFLDIVANIVGILIILVVLVGARTKDAWVEAATQSQQEANIHVRQEAKENEQLVQSLQSEINNINQKIEGVGRELAVRFQHREKLQELVLSIERRLEQQSNQLNAEQQQAFDLQRRLARTKKNLEDLSQQKDVFENSSPQTTVIQHLPTPLAKTVFGREEHFRLLNGRLAHVPMNELVDQLKGQWQQKIWKLKDAPQISETIGPVEGFRMKYTIRKATYLMKTSAGPMRRQRTEFAGFVLIPAANDLGEPFEKVFQPNSEFRRLLSTMDPSRTTITVWTYPNSFEQFRTLKLELFKLGFITAGRPMPAGQPIGGSPEGTRSAAQ